MYREIYAAKHFDTIQQQEDQYTEINTYTGTYNITTTQLCWYLHISYNIVYFFFLKQRTTQSVNLLHSSDHAQRIHMTLIITVPFKNYLVTMGNIFVLIGNYIKKNDDNDHFKNINFKLERECFGNSSLHVWTRTAGKGRGSK